MFITAQRSAQRYVYNIQKQNMHRFHIEEINGYIRKFHLHSSSIVDSPFFDFEAK